VVRSTSLSFAKLSDESTAPFGNRFNCWDMIPGLRDGCPFQKNLTF